MDNHHGVNDSEDSAMQERMTGQRQSIEKENSARILEKRRRREDRFDVSFNIQ